MSHAPMMCKVKGHYNACPCCNAGTPQSRHSSNRDRKRQRQSERRRRRAIENRGWMTEMSKDRQ